MPHCERLAPTEKLFVTPWYCSLLPDQSLALNRRRDDEGELKTEDLLDRQVRVRVTWVFCGVEGVTHLFWVDVYLECYAIHLGSR